MTDPTYQSRSAAETKKLGARFASFLKPGDVVGLIGELGAGKTTFIQGLATGLKVKHPKEVTSPTFVLIHEYAGKLPLYHIDLYRLGASVELDNLGLDEYLNSQGITVIEWADKFSQAFRLTYEVRFVSLGKDVRRISIVRQPL